jgi:hypothetical protein
LSREEGKRIKPPDYETVSPLAKWGFPEDGPYTRPSDVGKSLGGGEPPSRIISSVIDLTKSQISSPKCFPFKM